MDERSTWIRLLRALETSGPVLPALQPHLLRLGRCIGELQEVAPRRLRRRRALLRRAASLSRTARRARRTAG